ncbi:MAG: glutathione-disulfide reductase [Pseudomonadota bacterium]
MPGFDDDLAVIGAGSGGVRAARMAAQAGLRVTIYEASKLGGTCVNLGCIPKKLLSYGAHYRDDFQDAAGFGWQVEQPRFDWARLIAAKDRELTRLNGIYASLLHGAGVKLIEGHATLHDPHTIHANGQTRSAQTILIATGGVPVKPSIPGHELGDVSDAMFSLPHLPAHIVVIGGGYIAVEFASIFRGLGSHVTQLYRGDLFLRNFDDDLRTHLADAMQSHGVDLRFGCKLTSINKGDSDQRLRLDLDDGTELIADRVLFATGRKPNTEKLGLEHAGIACTERGAIQVDSYFRTTAQNIYAIGDVIDRVQLTPVAINEAMLFVDNLIHKKARSMAYHNIATAVFSNPNLATVGLSEQQARNEFDSIDIFKTSFKPLRGTLSGNEGKVLLKLVVDRKSDRVLGAHMAGPDAGEVIQALAVAIKAGACKADFDQTVAIHPTSAEEFVTMREAV